jgi:hypothetical protein
MRKKQKPPETGQANLSISRGNATSIYIKRSNTSTSKINKTKIKIMESEAAICNAPIYTGIHDILCRANGKGNRSS